MNKTEDIEWEIARILAAGPLTLGEMEARLPEVIRNDDRRWIGVAVWRMLGDGRMTASGCICPDHGAACVVEAGR